MRQIVSFIIIALILPLDARGEDATVFVADIYAKYQKIGQEFTPAGPGADTLFAPELLKLIRMDQQQANGETGYLDWDPFCDCQDTEGMEVDSLIVTTKGRMAQAIVKLSFPAEKKVVRLDLVKVSSTWRVRNIGGASVKDLYGFLSENLAED